MYRPSYHAAIRYLINATRPTKEGRRKIARAIRDLKRDHGRARALRELDHMHYVNSGAIVKEG